MIKNHNYGKENSKATKSDGCNIRRITDNSKAKPKQLQRDLCSSRQDNGESYSNYSDIKRKSEKIKDKSGNIFVSRKVKEKPTRKFNYEHESNKNICIDQSSA